jgi:glucosamine--fructose-6-phosphate aminotransferase (isomerizing)
MCGIVGILGNAPVAPLLLETLKRLEYRGYDSAGVATLVNGSIERRRAEGKLGNLEALLKASPIAGTVGIGHTRWATHGRPSEANAHPHANEHVAVVHNGIIENFQELRSELEAAGHTFETETDTEVIVHLISEHPSATPWCASRGPSRWPSSLPAGTTSWWAPARAAPWRWAMARARCISAPTPWRWRL